MRYRTHVHPRRKRRGILRVLYKYKMTKRLKQRIILFFAFLILMLLIFFFVKYPINTVAVVEKINSYGTIGPIILIFFIIIEVIIAPLPGSIWSVGAGYVFGALLGAIYIWIGNVIGGILSFILARKLGRRFVHKIVKEKTIKRYNDFMGDHRIMIWLLYLLPFSPTDVLNFVFGFSNIKLLPFTIVMAVLMFPRILLLTFYGEKLHYLGFAVFTLILTGMLLIGFGLSMLINHLDLKRRKAKLSQS